MVELLCAVVSMPGEVYVWAKNKTEAFYKVQRFQRASFPRPYYSLLISPVFPSVSYASGSF